MVGKLNQVLAIEKGVKSRVYGEITELHKIVQKPDLFVGFDKTYQPKDDQDGETLPAEKKRVQYVAKDIMRTVSRLSTELMNVIARKDWTNCVAKASVKIDDKVIIADAPVSYLLFMEKQLTDIHTLVKNMPSPDDAEVWNFDSVSGLLKTAPIQTHRTKKIAKPIVLIQPTVEHPGQAQMVAEDVIAGFWNQTKMSGAMQKADKQALLDRIEKLANAVKEAREAANVSDVVPTPEVGEAVFSYLLGD